MKARLTFQDYLGASIRLKVPVSVVQAVATVESKGFGFDPEDFPKTLFEAHKFHIYSDGKFDQSHPNLSGVKWDRSKYGKSWKEEKARLALACTLDREAALKSASWGEFQIMGFNYEACGCDSVQEYVNMNCVSSESQLNLFCNFLVSEGLVKLLRDGKYDQFFARYNGPAYKENGYDIKFQRALSAIIGVVQ